MEYNKQTQEEYISLSKQRKNNIIWSRVYTLLGCGCALGTISATAFYVYNTFSGGETNESLAVGILCATGTILSLIMGKRELEENNSIEEPETPNQNLEQIAEN